MENKTEVPKEEDIDKDMKERLEGFIPELKVLLGKYELGIGAFPEFGPDGTVHAKAIFLSTRKKPGQENTAAPAPEEIKVEDTGGLSE